MDQLTEILRRSRGVDARFVSLRDEDVDGIRVVYNVPSFHPRYGTVQAYALELGSVERAVEKIPRMRDRLFIVASAVANSANVRRALRKCKGRRYVVPSTEAVAKTKPFLDELIASIQPIPDPRKTVVLGVGGGLILNVSAFIAENLKSSLVLCPTTVLGMADGAGGKVRVNAVAYGRAYKHYYKSFYEPNAIIIDRGFLDTLPHAEMRIGLVEVIKHGLFQSAALCNYLVDGGERILSDDAKLLKVILWAADLKRVCLEVDVEENENGSRGILRAGHDFSDRLEEDLGLRIPHGLAVAIGIVRQLRNDGQCELLERALQVFSRFQIPVEAEEFPVRRVAGTIG